MTEAVQFFEAVQHSNMLALNVANLAEALVHLATPPKPSNAPCKLCAPKKKIRPYALTALGWVRQAQGQLGEAEHCFREAIQNAQQVEDRWAEAPAHRALGTLLQAQGKRDEACVASDSALSIYTALKLQGR